MLSKIIEKYIVLSTADREEIEIILYGMTIMGTNILTALIVILIGMILGQTISAVIYLGVLILLRRNVGGYHSKTYLGCLSVTSLSFIVIVILEKCLSNPSKETLGIIFGIYSAVVIYTATPTVHKNRIINETTIYRSNIKKDIYLSIILAFSTILHALMALGVISEPKYFFVTNSSLLLVALSISNKT